ncbi:urease accessory protein UreD [Puniceicoccaceae bacterium K14]|nr:urease accessory protein UreD [Puniceicoccaceae bacterium K14]
MPELTTLHQRLHGYLKLIAECDEDGRTRLSRRAFKPPIHISKAYWNDHSLLLNVMSPTAGLLQGDSIDIDVCTHPRTSLTLSSPAALRIHKMENGLARLTQAYHVASNSFVEMNPEWLIPQAQSSFLQKTILNIEAGGELLFIEAFAPGRVAHGETFSFDRFDSHLRLSYDNRLSALEHFSLSDRTSLQPWKGSIKNAFYISAFLVSEKLEQNSEIWKEIHALQSSDILVGCSQLAQGPCWSVKLLSEKPEVARRMIEQIRQLFYLAIGRHCSNLRRQ